MQTHATSQEGLDLIKTFEGFRAEAEALHEGGWVIGYGHVRMAAPEAPMSAEEAERQLALDLAPFERFVNAKVTMPISQAQFDALVSFCFSVGVPAFETSDVLRKVNAGHMIAAALAMDAWRKSAVSGESEIYDLLICRRAAEKALFLRGAPVAPAPSAHVRAQKDHAAAILSASRDFAVAPPLSAAPQPRTPEEEAQRLGDILRAGPRTALVLTEVLAGPPAPAQEAEPEPSVAQARPAARQIFTDARRAKRPPARVLSETFAQACLMALGVALVGVGGSMAVSARAAGEAVAALAFIAPGLAACALALASYVRAAKAGA